MEKTLSRSVKKFIRSQKAKIRARFFDFKKQEEMINELYKKYLPESSKEATDDKKEESFALEKVKSTNNKSKKNEKPTNKTKNKSK